MRPGSAGAPISDIGGSHLVGDVLQDPTSLTKILLPGPEREMDSSDNNIGNVQERKYCWHYFI